MQRSNNHFPDIRISILAPFTTSFHSYLLYFFPLPFGPQINKWSNLRTILAQFLTHIYRFFHLLYQVVKRKLIFIFIIIHFHFYFHFSYTLSEVFMEAISLPSGSPKDKSMICLHSTSTYTAQAGSSIVVVLVVVIASILIVLFVFFWVKGQKTR